MALKQEGACKSSFQPQQRYVHRVEWVVSIFQLLAYEMSDHLGICVRSKARASLVQLIASTTRTGLSSLT
jgi:hypothetical protein